MPRKRKRKPAKLPKRVIVAAGVHHNVERDKEMFFYHMAGHTFQEVADQFHMSFDNVRRVAKLYDWAGVKRERAQRAYAEAMSGLRKSAAVVMDMLDRDTKLLYADMVKNLRQLSKEERSHTLAYMDRILKEVRLEDGKPTENTGGNMIVEIQLPPGVKHYGLIPPSKSVKYVEAEQVETKPTIDLDEVEHRLTQTETSAHDLVPSKPSPNPETQPKEEPGVADPAAGVPRDVGPEDGSSDRRQEAWIPGSRRPSAKRGSTPS